MSVDEVRAWIIPPDFDHTEAEARHLMEESDTDHDEKLTKQVGSLVTSNEGYLILHYIQSLPVITTAEALP